MAILEFPPLEDADEHGLLGLGGDLEVESLLLAYRSGIFPWPLNHMVLAWFSPPQRALLWLNELHISESLRKERKRGRYQMRVDYDFKSVIEHCSTAKNRKGQKGTWITKDVVAAYEELHRHGHAHCIGCYEGDALVGGLYGISIGGMFAGESMFHIKPNASKLSFWFLAEYLQQRNFSWIDCQVLTPLLKSFGAREIARSEFVGHLNEALQKDRVSFLAAAKEKDF